jgi:uncharacterized membrane protein YfcA
MIFSVFVICLAGFAQGLTGFGFGLVAISLLPLMMNLKEATALTALLNLVVCSMTFYSLRRHYHWRRGWGLIVGASLGVPLGVYMLISRPNISCSPDSKYSSTQLTLSNFKKPGTGASSTA